jgi:hypothetical protein
MYFYHENYHASYYDAYDVDATLQDLTSRDLSGDDRTSEPIRVPRIVNWLVIVSVVLCAVFTAVDILS